MEKRTSRGALSLAEVIKNNAPPCLRVVSLLAETERQWDEIAGPRLAGRTRPLSLDRDVLVVACETPAAAQMVNMSGGTLAARVKDAAGLDLMGVRAVVRRLAPRRARTAPPRGRRLSPAKKDVDAAFARVSAVVRDPEVALAVARAEAAAKARWGGGRHKKV